MPPAPFRELWGIEVPGGTPEPKPKHFTAATYEKNYQDPRDDWGVTGGILRCNDDGTGLEIVSRGFRNPWDIAFDDQFNWLGTDNDQTMGDKLFAPFYGAHFGWATTGATIGKATTTFRPLLPAAHSSKAPEPESFSAAFPITLTNTKTFFSTATGSIAKSASSIKMGRSLAESGSGKS